MCYLIPKLSIECLIHNNFWFFKEDISDSFLQKEFFFFCILHKKGTFWTDLGQITWREGNLAIAQKNLLRHNSTKRVMTFDVGSIIQTY